MKGILPTANEKRETNPKTYEPKNLVQEMKHQKQPINQEKKHNELVKTVQVKKNTFENKNPEAKHPQNQKTKKQDYPKAHGTSLENKATNESRPKKTEPSFLFFF